MTPLLSIFLRKIPAVLRHLSLVFLIGTATCQHLTNKDVLVLFNTADPDSGKLAEDYREARDIPADRLVGLEMPLRPDITRAEYEKSILIPLRKHFEEKSLWRRGRDPQGVLLPTSCDVRVIVLMRGVPLRIQPSPPTQEKEGETAKPADPIADRDEASVDSELALFGVESLPAKGVLKNAFFESTRPLSRANMPYLILTSRIDAPTYGTCKRMISDAIATEKTGLWGRAYIDIANKFPQGDKWLEEIVSENQKHGIPTTVDRFNDTFPKNYPMTETSIYYGWYDWSVSGPFLNTRFIFKRGAVAIHLHSFSAQQLDDPHKNWCAPLLVRGAAATVGNVYEPYLHLTHYFDVLQDRLLDGWSFAEASWAAMPVCSWQGIVLGDPLYRPFLHLGGTGENRPEERDFRALAAASRQWPDKPTERREKLAAAAEKLSSGNLAEGLADEYLEEKDYANARIWLEKAKGFHPAKADKLRQEISLIAIDRAAGNTSAAISALRAAKEAYGHLSEAEALSGWLDILDPPPPPVADPTKIKK